MTDELLNAFEEGLNALAAGERLEAILTRYAVLADDLRPMLETAHLAQALSAPGALPAPGQQASRTRFLARAAELRAPRRGWLAGGFGGLNLAGRALTLVALVFGLGAYGVITASAQSMPGDPLYGVKRTVEQAQLLFSPDPRMRAQLEERFSERRVEEVQQLTTQGRAEAVEFGGQLESLTEGEWKVAGIRVIVSAETSVVGFPFPGLFVEVFGASQPDGTVRASLIEVEGTEFYGRVEAIGPETWQVAGQTIWVNAQTEIVGDPQVGDWVEVHTRTWPDGRWLALQIILTQEGLSPTATTPTAAPTPTEPALTQAVLTPTTGKGTPTTTPAPNPTQADSEEVELTGVVEAAGPEAWQINGQVVRLTAATEIRDNPQVGQRVKVKALVAADGTLTALRIELDKSGPSPSNTPGLAATEGDATETHEPSLRPSDTPEPTETDEPEEVRFEGTLEAINGSTWVVGGQAVAVTGSTEIRNNPQIGDQVEVRALRQGDGSLLATRIEKK
ncbi:MAG: DUF5666 domain-containing protein [Anaerolineales bacterium]